jgi:hypothetical protein
MHGLHAAMPRSITWPARPRPAACCVALVRAAGGVVDLLLTCCLGVAGVAISVGLKHPGCCMQLTAEGTYIHVSSSEFILTCLSTCAALT